MSATEQPPHQTEIDLGEVLAEMDDLGRAKWETAVARVENRKLRQELARLSNAQNVPAPGEEPIEEGVGG